MWLSSLRIILASFTESCVESLFLHISISRATCVHQSNHQPFCQHTNSPTRTPLPTPTLINASPSLSGLDLAQLYHHLIVLLIHIVLMMNLVSFETASLVRQERVHATSTTTTAIRSMDASSKSTFFDGHLDLSLGMSMSAGGSGCDATRCTGAKTGDGRGNCSSDEVGCLSSGVTTVTAANAFNAGHDHAGGLIAGAAGWTSAYMPSPTGFMHPWSLAARQQKAAAEQNQTKTAAAAYAPSEARAITSPSAVGWPPVHTSRRNLITAMHTTKSDGARMVNGPKDATMPAGNEKKNSTGVAETRPLLANMFAKVHMEGYAIARKINLRAHGSYNSLSQVLTKMTRNFFCPADCSSVNAGEEGFCTSDKFIFLYEDFEGDRMLVGDVPWELFLASAKRLYIVRNPVPGDKGLDCDKNGTTERAINN